MAVFITRSDFESYWDKDYIKQLATDKSDVGDLTDTRITNIIAAADSTLRGALSKQYTDAEMEADASVKYACSIIAIYNLEARKAQGHTQGVLEAYAALMTKLQKLQIGDDKLQAVAQLVPTGSPTEAAKVFEQSGYFTGLAEII